jgi:RsiW-degrading membrane proteinase PrsW (M82 family)
MIWWEFSLRSQTMSPSLFAFELKPIHELIPLPEKFQMHQYHPMLTIPAYVVVGIGIFLLLIALFRFVTGRIFRSFFTVVAALLIAGYYPITYVALWQLMPREAAPAAPAGDVDPTKAEDAKEEMPKAEEPPAELNKTQQFIKTNMLVLNWGVLVVSCLVGLLIFLMTLGGGRRTEVEEENYMQPQPVRVAAPRQRQGRRPPAQPEKDPFDFS